MSVSVRLSVCLCAVLSRLYLKDYSSGGVMFMPRLGWGPHFSICDMLISTSGGGPYFLAHLSEAQDGLMSWVLRPLLVS